MIPKLKKLFTLATITCSSSHALSQQELPVFFEIHGAQDIRDFCLCPFTDMQFDGVKGIATDGDTLVIGRTAKIDSDTADAPYDPMVPGEVLIYRRNTSGSGAEFQLIDIFNDSVIGFPGASLVSPDDQYGWDVALNNNTLVVSAPYYPHYTDNTSLTPTIEVSDPGSYGFEDETGAVFIYTRPNNTSNDWTLDQVIYDNIEVNGERFGYRVMFHDDRLLIASSRNHRPGYSAVGSKCQNISSSVTVYSFSSTSNQWEHLQTIDLPFLPWEPNYGAPSNGDPVDNVENCGPSLEFPLGVPPIASRDGQGWEFERARDFDVYGDWLVTVGHPGMFIYRYDTSTSQYGIEQAIGTSSANGGLPTGYSTGNKGYTSVAIDNDVIVVGIKNMKQEGTNETGGIAVFELDTAAPTNPWALTFADTIGGGNGIEIYNDTIINVSSSLWRYDRLNNTVLAIGRVTDAGGSPHMKSAVYENRVLLASNLSRVVVPHLGPNKVYAVSLCPYDFTDDGALDYNDISEFNSIFAAGDMRADFAEPYGSLDFFDVNHFLELYNTGCP